MAEEQKAGSILRKIAPRIVIAAAKGVAFFILLYVIPSLFISQVSQFAPELFEDYQQLLFMFAAITIFFVVTSELTAGSIYQHAFNIGRSIILIMFFVMALNGGIVSFSMNLGQMPIGIWADLRIILILLLTIDLLVLARSMLQAISFLSENAEKQLLPLKPLD